MNCPYRLSSIIRSRKMVMVDLLSDLDCVRADTPGVYHASFTGRHSTEKNPAAPAAQFNSALDLKKEGKLDKAEALCRQLLKQYPDQVDGIEKMAMVEEARGHYSRAAEYYLQAASFIHGKPGFDPESEYWYRQMAAQMDTKANAG